MAKPGCVIRFRFWRNVSGRSLPWMAWPAGMRCFEKRWSFCSRPRCHPRKATRTGYARIRKRQLIPYILDAADAHPTANLEGFTHADAVLVSEETGFSVAFESKVCADISYDITFDLMRNQICRYVDVMLETPTEVSSPLSKRNPERTLFCLVTPKMSKDNWRSRLYGHLMHQYWEHPGTLGDDLPHRADHVDWSKVSRRLGWITWEDCKAILPDACGWIEDKGFNSEGTSVR